MIRKLETEMVSINGHDRSSRNDKIKVSNRIPKQRTVLDCRVSRTPGRKRVGDHSGLWLSPESVDACPVNVYSRLWWWMPPVIWPGSEDHLHTQIRFVKKKGACKFVLNAPWQRDFFDNRKGLTLWAGPFCNSSNGLAVRVLKNMGFSGVIVSPELGQEDYFMLPGQSCLPLGMVLSGNWPLCISRILAPDLNEGEPFASPRGETAWAVKYGDEYWVYPNWKVDIRGQRNQLERAGYSLFVHLEEPVPEGIKMKKRPGLWNWKVGLQ
jgi:putative protease